MAPGEGERASAAVGEREPQDDVVERLVAPQTHQRMLLRIERHQLLVGDGISPPPPGRNPGMRPKRRSASFSRTTSPAAEGG
jgi:hypothetical protein